MDNCGDGSEADHAADIARKRPGFSEVDFAADVSAAETVQAAGLHPTLKVATCSISGEDHYRARRLVERQALIERMPELLRQRDALLEQLPDMPGAEQVAAGLRIAAIANESAESYARIQGQDRPPPADALVGVALRR